MATGSLGKGTRESVRLESEPSLVAVRIQYGGRPVMEGADEVVRRRRQNDKGPPHSRMAGSRHQSIAGQSGAWRARLGERCGRMISLEEWGGGLQNAVHGIGQQAPAVAQEGRKQPVEAENLD
jgi:hypothetical protein